MYLKTVKHLLGLFSGLKAGQLEISPSKKDYIMHGKVITDKSFFFFQVQSKKMKDKLKEKVKSDEKLVC